MTRLSSLVNAVQHIVHRSIIYDGEKEKKMRRLYDDASTVKRKKGQSKKRWRRHMPS
jgi:hypothetical protein